MSNEANPEETTHSIEESRSQEYERLASQVEDLESELESLRFRYPVDRQFRRRRVAVSLGLIGMVFYASTWYFPELEELLLILSGTGLFASILMYYLTPGRLIPAAYSERIFDPLLSNQADVLDELGLQDIHIYVPIPPDEDDRPNVMVFTPQFEDYELPPASSLQYRFVGSDGDSYQGVSFRPSAIQLIEDFKSALSTDLSSNPTQLAAQLLDGLENDFEIIDSAQEDVYPNEGRAVFRLSKPYYNAIETFDNPIVSFLGTGLAQGLDKGIRVDANKASQDEFGNYTISCEWPVDE